MAADIVVIPSAEDFMPAEEAREQFVIDDDSKATWALKQLREIRRRQEINVSIAKSEMENIKTWLDQALSAEKRDEEFFIAILSRYGLEQRLEEGRKTIKLPYGEIATREGSVEWKIEDEPFLAWAWVNAPDLIKVVETPKLAEVQKALKITDDGSVVTEAGEIVPGVVTTRKDPTVTVKTII